MAYLDFTEDSIDIDYSATCSIPNYYSNHTNTFHNKNNDFITNSTYTRYIITFNTYELITIHTSFIKHILSSIPHQSYQIIQRTNPAINEYPTDFIILNINNHNTTKHNNILSLLKQSTNIKYINIDKILHNKHPNKRNILHSDNDKHSNHPHTGGKLFTKFMPFEDDNITETNHNRKLLAHFLITNHLGAKTLWDDGYHGENVNVAVFDTGIDDKNPQFNNIDERTNWTDEDQLHDGIGHGTFVCGIIASKFSQCPGFAPDAIIHTFRVFTNQQMSYTSWFLDAFNYAIFRKMNLLNLSIGGPDWLDLPFVDKVREMQANNVIMITACGNDGKYGTINNPADQLSVIGVGGITQNNQQIAGFQSRGMTTWELPNGYGRVKPDIVTVGQSLYGAAVNGGCRTLSGTSVASPVVVGVSALLTSVVPNDIRWDVINPASLKQILVESADTIDNLRIFEQGNGKINLQSAYKYILDYKKHVSAVPGSLDFTQCPHFWPFCRQPLYYTSEPYIFNLTLLNPFSVIGEISSSPEFEITSIIFDNGDIIQQKDIENDFHKYNYIRMEFEYSDKLWPWCGWLGIYIYAESIAKNINIVSLSGIIKVNINVINKDPKLKYNPYNDYNKWELHKLSIPYSLKIIAQPSSSIRILWDQYHNIQYPFGYFPRDDLEKDSDMLDWFGDHLHTNYHTLYDFIKDKGYFIEILRSDYSCINSTLYSTLIIVDSEDKFHISELKKLQYDILNNELSIIIFADWYNQNLMNDVRFFDDNTRSLWDALTGGANIVAINQLLNPFGIQFGDMVAIGDIKIDNSKQFHTYFQSGSIIMKSPINSYVLLTELLQLKSAKRSGKTDSTKYKVIPLTMYDTKHMNVGINPGRISVFGDSTCLDANQHRKDCFWIMDMLLKYSCENKMDEILKKNMIKITNENINEIFSNNYLSKMNIPKINKHVEPLFNQISRVHNIINVKCPKNMEIISDINSMDDVIHIQNKKLNVEYKNIIENEPILIVVNDKKINNIIQPHLY
eukprot:254291_1